MGHLVVARAAETAIELARECGVAWVGCRMSGHAGAAGVYAALPLKADMIGIYSAVANANHMPLAGGAEPLLGTNPLAIAIPAGKEPPVVLDIATSIVSYGTIKNHRLQNRPLQGDWMIDPKTGEAVIDPQKSAEALLLPMAGYKGAGLALMLGLLAGTLNGALFGRDCVDFNAEPDKVTNTGQFVLALDPSRFQPLDQFKAEVDRHIRELRNSKTLPGQSVRLPGEQRAQRRADRLRNGLTAAAGIADAARQTRAPNWRSSRCASAVDRRCRHHITASFWCPWPQGNKSNKSQFIPRLALGWARGRLWGFGKNLCRNQTDEAGRDESVCGVGKTDIRPRRNYFGVQRRVVRNSDVQRFERKLF